MEGQTEIRLIEKLSRVEPRYEFSNWELGKSSNNSPSQSAEPFPSTLTLAHFSSLVYRPKKEEIIEYLSEHNLSDWKLLAACNGRYAYRGVALLNSSMKQIVLVHRGTVKTSFGNLFSDYRILFQGNTGYQLQEACTFADAVRALAVQGGFQLVITGHSMGGVLAQVTAASVKFLRLDGDVFVPRREEDFDETHPHVKTFESPGSFDVIRTMLKTNPLHVGMERAVTFLDVTNFVMGPNIVNTIAIHFGTLICVDKALKGMGKQRTLVIKGVDKHPIAVFIKLFESKQEVSLRIFNWAHTSSTLGLMRKVAGGLWKFDASRTTAFADFSFRMWPDYCFTQKEMSFLQLVNFAAKLGVSILAEEAIPRFYIHGTHFKMIKFPSEISADERDAFVMKIRRLAQREKNQDCLENQIEAISRISFSLLKELGAQFSCPVLSDLYLISLSPVKKSWGKLKEIVNLQNGSDFDKKLLAVLIRNTWMNKRPNSMGIVFPDRATFERMFVNSEHFKNSCLLSYLLLIVVVKSNEEKVTPASSLLTEKYGKRLKFVFIQTSPEDSLDEEDIDKEDFNFRDLSEHSKNELQNFCVGLQKEKYKVRLSEFANFLSNVNLFKLGQKLETGTFLPQTWESSALANNFYIHAPPVNKAGTIFDMSLNIRTTILRIIAANPGMGKTACLSNFRHQIKNFQTDIFVFMISLRKLNRHLDDSSKIAGREIEIIKSYHEMDEFDAQLLDFAMSTYWRVIFLFDGFDEVSPNSRRNCQMMLQYFVRHIAVMQVWLTSRKEALRQIENSGILLNYELYDLGLFTREQQKLYLEQLLAAKKKKISQEITRKYMSRLDLVSSNFGADTLGVPLTLRLLVEMGAHNTETKLFKPYQLIDKFLDMKFAIYYFEKVGVDSRTISNSELTEIRLSYNFNLLTFYALRQVYSGTDSFCKSLQELESQIKDARELTRIKNLGLLDGNNEFFHRTMAEFLIANSVKIAFGFHSHEWQSSHLQEWLENGLKKIPGDLNPFHAYLIKLFLAKMSPTTWCYLNDMVGTESKKTENGLLNFLENNQTARIEIQNRMMEHNLNDLFDFLAEKKSIFRTTRHSVSHRPFVHTEVPILIESIAQNRLKFTNYLLSKRKYLQEACDFCTEHDRYFVFHDIAKYNLTKAFSAFWQKLPNKNAINSSEFSNICMSPADGDQDCIYSLEIADNRNILGKMYHFTPLHIAVLLRHEQMVSMLLEAGASVHPMSIKVSPLLAFISAFFESAGALKEGKVGILEDRERRILKTLLDHGAMLTIRNSEARKREFIRKLDEMQFGAVFLELIKEDDYQEVGWGEYFSYFLSESQAMKQVNSHCKFLSSTLPAAIRRVHKEDCEDTSCVLRSSDNMPIRDVVRKAVENGHESCTELFLRNNSHDLFFVDEQLNLVSIALEKGHTHIFKTILSKNPELLHASNKYGYKPVHLAAKFLNKEAMVFLADSMQQDLDERTTYGRSVVHIAVAVACKSEKRDILELLNLLLVEREMDASSRDFFGKTPLHFACKFSPKFSVIEMLIRAGSDVNARCSAGNTPLHILADKGPDKYLHIYCAALLKRHGASVELRNDLLDTPIDIARRGHKVGICDVLMMSCEQLDAASVCGFQERPEKKINRLYHWTRAKISKNVQSMP
ncbi:Hypothetical predicted protein [Cloeon dipterum]|uniref:NACHT domain-containing protein n=1 Tax=Cloeon dipterum TaxID=197152 RepID=A0A8S1C5M5_9INSE|nr:Hypothetical predicted protein [Cloeon dipterum]